MSERRHPSGKRLPDFLASIPWWYPGSWGPPALTVSLASAAMTAFASWYLFRDELVRAMFRFQPDWLAVIFSIGATALSGRILQKTSARPGKLLPRVWALALTAFCAGLTLWTLYASITSRGNVPALHALVAVALLSSLTLAPRLFHLHPFSSLIRHVALFAVAFVLLFCFPLVLVSERIVVDRERNGLEEKIAGLQNAAKEIDSILHSAPVKASVLGLEQARSKKFEDVDFRKFLPDQSDWKALGLLQRQKPGLLCENRMREAMANLVKVLQDADFNPDAPRLAQASIWADGVAENNETRWKENGHFQNQASTPAVYYHELGRMFKDFEVARKISPFQPDYEEFTTKLEKDLEDRAEHMGELWIPAVFLDESSSLASPKLIESRVGDSDGSLGDLDRWKNLTWSQAESLRNKPGCLSEPQKLQRHEYVDVPDPDHPGEMRKELKLRHYRRMECYAYSPSQEGKSLEILAELHLTYREEDDRNYVRSSAPPYSTVLLFDVRQKDGHSKEQLMLALSDYAANYYHTTPENSSGITPTQGFAVRSKFTARPSEIRRLPGVTTIQIRVY